MESILSQAACESMPAGLQNIAFCFAGELLGGCPPCILSLELVVGTEESS